MEWAGFVLGRIWAQEALCSLDLLSSLGSAGGARSRLVRTQKPRLWLCPAVYLSLWASFSPYKERGALTILSTRVCKLPLSPRKLARLSLCCPEISTHETEEIDT